jgi:hypothetical protein
MIKFEETDGKYRFHVEWSDIEARRSNRDGMTLEINYGALTDLIKSVPTPLMEEILMWE